MTDEQTPWWAITIRTETPDDTGAMLIEGGAGGVEEIRPDTLRVYFHGDGAALERFTTSASELGAAVLGAELVAIRNWVQEAESHWAPLLINDLHIIPVLDSGERAKPETEHPIYINPGTGFGTGHHPTTHMVLGLLQLPVVRALASHSPTLDLGTGSGILALGASELYGATVDAIEIDPLALENAARNVALNPTAGARVRLIEGDLSKATGTYPLITANIYAEVLCELEGGFWAHSAPGTVLLVSGIMAKLKDSVLHGYHRWRTVEIREDRGWVAIAFERPKA
jgi:ribosomal protein L11 methyltransferase